MDTLTICFCHCCAKAMAEPCGKDELNGLVIKGYFNWFCPECAGIVNDNISKLIKSEKAKSETQEH
jgi:hypothetical protein